MSLSIMVLAAGKGTRMKSVKPKVLHELAGKPMLSHVLDTGRTMKPGQLCVVYGFGGEMLQTYYQEQNDISWVLQAEQLGTGHAVQQGISEVQSSDIVLILYGDVPLTKLSTLESLVGVTSQTQLGLLTTRLSNPTGYGRIVRDTDGRVSAIVEEKDASEEQKKIDEVNTGIMAIPVAKLTTWLQQLNNDNAQGEYYLTDIISMAVNDGVEVVTQIVDSDWEVAGVNSQSQLANLERQHQYELAQALMAEGAAIKDPNRIDIRGSVKVGKDVSFDVDVVLEGDIEIGSNVSVGPFCHIKNATIGDSTQIHSHCVIEDSVVGQACNIGPFARLRPDTQLSHQAKIGNFVEIKKSVIGKGSKVNHLSYVGDAEVGEEVNIGAGVITCNYDGANKHKTEIGDNVFVGSDVQLVAPVKIDKDATIGAGATITNNVEAGSLALSRVKQRAIKNWKRPVKKK